MFRSVVRLAPMVLLGLVLASLIPAMSMPAASAPVAGSQPVEETLSLAMVPGAGTLQLRGQDPTSLGTPTALTGSLDGGTGAISAGAFSTPTISIVQEITTPIATRVFIDAAFSQATPATGLVDFAGNIVVDASMKVDLDIVVEALPSLPGDCQASPVDLQLTSSTPYDSSTGRVTLADADFTVPQVVASSSCDALLVDPINDQLAGAGHSISLTLEGHVTLPPAPSDATVTTLTANPQTSSRVGQPVVLAASVVSSSGPGSVPSGFVDFHDHSSVIATVSLENGTATLTMSALPVGEHVFTARYRGDSTFASSTSEAVTHVVAANPLVDASALIPDQLTYGDSPVEFAVAVTNTGLGSDESNVRFNLRVERVQGSGAFGLSRISLEYLADGAWTPATLQEQGVALHRPVSGFVGASAGFSLPAGTEFTQRLRIAFPDVGGTWSPTECGLLQPTCPGPFRIAVELVHVDPVSGDAGEPLTATSGIVNLVEATRRTPTVSITSGAPRPHTVRQGNSFDVRTSTGPLFGQIGPTGSMAYFIDGLPVRFRANNTPLSEGYPFESSVLSAAGTTSHQLIVPPTMSTGRHALTLKYSGDLFHSPAQVSTEITVVQGANGTPYECVEPTNVVRFGTTLMAHGNLPAARPSGTDLDIANLAVAIQAGPVMVTDPLTGIPNGTVTQVGTGGLDAVGFEFGPTGTGTGDAIERIGGARQPATPYPADPASVDQMLTFLNPSGGVRVEGATGEVVPVTLERVVVDYHSGPLRMQLSCLPLGEPIVLGGVTIAGTTLAASPSGPVPAGRGVTLTANTFPASAPGFVVFRDGTRDIGVVPVVNGTASMTTDQLTVGSHNVTARFFGGLTVPSTVSDPVEVVVEPPAVGVSPATGLLDGAPMTVTVSNGAPGASYTLAMCRASLCAAGQQVTAGPDGTVATTVPAVQRFTATGGRNIVCRADCAVVVRGPGNGEARASFAMAAGSLTVAPNTGLVDGQSVQVTGTDLMPTYDGPPLLFETGDWLLLQCHRNAGVGPNLFGMFVNCAFPTQAVTVEGSTLDVAQPVRSRIDRLLGGTTDCTQPEECVIGLFRWEQDGSLSAHVAPINFDTG